MELAASAGSRTRALLQCTPSHRMADWKQITARIRRARTGKDPVAQLCNLFEKTHDAMVAFELARHLETTGQNAEAAKWYSTASERFRRADWKTKAQEAATRLSGLPPVQAPASHISDSPPETSQTSSLAIPEPGLPFMQNAEVFESLADSESSVPSSEETPAAPATDSAPGAKAGRRRRGRRGGRNRRKPAAAGDGASSGTPAPPHRAGSSSSSQRASSASADEPPASRFTPAAEAPALRLPIEPGPAATDAGGIALRGRYGDPGLSSRLSLLEMQFRRLLTCAPVTLNDSGSAPAGPGVFLLSDSDLTSYYYVEACQTLRIAIPNLLRGGSSRRGADSIKPQLAQHLGIPETRVGKYLADHCVVRWLQLDEGASHFAHFVVSVLRPTLND
jgi:hypothetical protein